AQVWLFHGRHAPQGNLGVTLYGADFAARGDEVLIRLQASAPDPQSALRHALLDNPSITKAEALTAVRRVCGHYAEYAFECDWPQARRDIGLPARGRPGRPKKITG